MRQREMEKYTDRLDVDGDTSLYEYGFIRNPKTDETICCINTYVGDEDISDWHKARKYILRNQYISFAEVFEALEDASDGYYSFIGSDRQTELDNY